MPDVQAKCAGCQQTPALFPFTMAFQPILDLQLHTIDAHEALVRGPNGEGASTILGQVNDENRYAFDQACRVKAIELATSLRLEGRLNINFLPKAVYEPKACIRLTLETARRTGFPLDRLTFEFVETEEIFDKNHILSIIEEYRRHGFQIALDDFGTCYSGLVRLADLGPDIIKLDRALIKDCDQSRTLLRIVASMVSLGAELGIKVVAEGVERREEVDALRSVGVRFVQGFYFARPIFQGIAHDNTILWPSFGPAVP
jgi:EAL domain-containing protein (putative c-di-GMP-specific phosphodiesterase class I)